jgi:hypothetical protein
MASVALDSSLTDAQRDAMINLFDSLHNDVIKHYNLRIDAPGRALGYHGAIARGESVPEYMSDIYVGKGGKMKGGAGVCDSYKYARMAIKSLIIITALSALGASVALSFSALTTFVEVFGLGPIISSVQSSISDIIHVIISKGPNVLQNVLNTIIEAGLAVNELEGAAVSGITSIVSSFNMKSLMIPLLIGVGRASNTDSPSKTVMEDIQTTISGLQEIMKVVTAPSRRVTRSVTTTLSELNAKYTELKQKYPEEVAKEISKRYNYGKSMLDMLTNGVCEMIDSGVKKTAEELSVFLSPIIDPFSDELAAAAAQGMGEALSGGRRKKKSHSKRKSSKKSKKPKRKTARKQKRKTARKSRKNRRR